MPASPCRIPSLPLAALCLALLPALSAAQAQRQEYSLRQEADEGLLVRVNGYEADFRSALSEYGEEAALFAEVPGERLAPLFHYLSPPTKGRELVLVVETLAGTARTRYQVEPVRITVRDERSAQLAAAYRALAQGVDAEGGAGAAAWAVRIYGLDQAAGTFAGLGMQDLYSWSAFYAAWFVLHRLGDSHSALDRAEQLLESLRGVRRQAVRLATLRLRADILAAQRLAGELPGQPDDPLQQAWEEVAALAADEDQQLELAAARFAQGRDLATREQPQLALERYREAQAIADRIGATALGTQVRESMVGVLGQQGDLGATGEVLAEIGDALAQRGDADPLALNLLEQGLLAIRTHRPGRAVAPLEEALSLSVNSLTRSQLQLALAQARFATGRLDDARALALDAVMVPGSGDIRRPIPALEVNAGLDLLAAVHRLRGEREALQDLRDAQARWLGGAAQRAEFLWQRALDAWGSPAAGARFAAAAQAPGDAGLRSLAAAWACALGAASGGCGALPAPASFGAPWQQMEAQFASATQLARGGQPAGAGRALRTLVGQALYLRERMPGVLDVWIMERAPALADSLLGPLLAGDDATGALSALALLRRLETAPGPAGADEADDAFRAALAECEAAGSTCTGAELIRTRMASGYAAFRGERPWLAGDGLGAWLGGLAPGQALVTWHIDPQGAFAFRADAGGVRKWRLADAQGLLALLAQARERLPVLEGADFDALAARLGAQLLAPLGDELPQQLLVAPAGPLLGLTPDAWRLDGHWLAERCELIQLLDFPAAPPPRPTPWTAPGGVFVAGAPADFAPGAPQTLALPAGLRAAMDAFIGPGLQVVQGGALLPDEFADPRFGAAALLHLALPAQLDLERPRQSWLELSEPQHGAGRARLDGAALAAIPLNARLAWLPQSRITGTPATATGNWLPLVHELLGAGAEQVLASAWTPSAEEEALLVAALYRALAGGATVPSALRTARLERLRSGAAARDAAALSLYRR